MICLYTPRITNLIFSPAHIIVIQFCNEYIQIRLINDNPIKPKFVDCHQGRKAKKNSPPKQFLNIKEFKSLLLFFKYKKGFFLKPIKSSKHATWRIWIFEKILFNSSSSKSLYTLSIYRITQYFKGLVDLKKKPIT